VNGGDNVFVQCVVIAVHLSVCAQRSGQSDQFKKVKSNGLQI